MEHEWFSKHLQNGRREVANLRHKYDEHFRYYSLTLGEAVCMYAGFYHVDK